MGEQRAFKGVWIPAEVWLSDELTIYEKAVFAEIDSLDGENHCWASNEYLAKFCKMSEVTISRSISKLIQLGFIEKLSFDGRQRVLAVNKSKLISQIRETYLPDKSELSTSENLLLIENKKDNNIKGTGAGALTKHPRNFSKEKLTDELSSGKIIDEQKREKKKETEYEKCLKLLDERYDDPKLYSSLCSHLEWSYKSGDPKRIKTAKVYSKRLDDLDKLQGDKEKIVKQSLDKQWHCFYELQTSDKKSYTAHSESKIQHQTMSAEEAKALLAKEAEEYGVI